MVDEVPVLALAACFAEGETVIRDAQELAVKESDRLATVTSTLAAFGADVERTSDGMIIRGGASLTGAPVLSHGDHRIAMMAAVAARCIAGETQVQDVDCVNTSFPGFLPMLESVTR
jgi:3-phosphoshikimate 1-carboxyvinyltransferase